MNKIGTEMNTVNYVFLRGKCRIFAGESGKFQNLACSCEVAYKAVCFK